jgi:flagellar L-ring protein precursor FlgH
MMKQPLIILAAMAMLSGCMPTVASVTKDVNKPAVDEALQTPMPDTTKTGSLWAAGNNEFFSDPKARHVGDMVTVLVSESASATRKLGTDKSRKSSRSTSINAFLGYEKSLAAKNPNFTPSTAVDLSNDNTFSGAGDTSNSDTLTAQVTAVVTKVYPNGNMEIRGRRQLTINQQPQQIVFTGIIRPMDIAPDNTIPSSKVAQAQISYGGGGELASVTHEGWLSRTLDMIWPF